MHPIFCTIPKAYYAYFLYPNEKTTHTNLQKKRSKYIRVKSEYLNLENDIRVYKRVMR